ncbi:ANTAR domain-containing protein [Streptomyces phaeochromogenes]|uniref:ANTAR domain-containing protein n=1 Tax=Streptomyces phaeochromogenes TaxID=1923 RepID=UPI0027D7FDA7|nr:ANTAR domain-containing protein [Streptomyces phaeochromogenes]
MQHAMESRPVIDMARGVLDGGFACRPQEAWEILVAVSQNANVKLRDVAKAITEATDGQPMPAELQEHLAAAVQTWRARHERGSSG